MYLYMEIFRWGDGQRSARWAYRASRRNALWTDSCTIYSNDEGDRTDGREVAKWWLWILPEGLLRDTETPSNWLVVLSHGKLITRCHHLCRYSNGVLVHGSFTQVYHWCIGHLQIIPSSSSHPEKCFGCLVASCCHIKSRCWKSWFSGRKVHFDIAEFSAFPDLKCTTCDFFVM